MIISKFKIINTIHDVTPHYGEKSIFKYKIMAKIGVFFTSRFIIHGDFLKSESFPYEHGFLPVKNQPDPATDLFIDFRNLAFDPNMPSGSFFTGIGYFYR